MKDAVKKQILFLINERQLFCCLLFFLLSCNNNTAHYANLVVTKEDSAAQRHLLASAFLQIDSLPGIIHSGDLITRTGNDFTSESLRTLNQHDKTYSHCGIASIEHDSIFVYHALGGEFNPDQKIRRDEIAIFAEPNSNRGIGIFRYQLRTGEAGNVVNTAKKLYTAGIMFDMKFDLATDDRMYCAEFVYKCYSAATHNRLHFEASKIKAFTFMGVDNLFLHPLCHPVKRLVYK